MKPYGARAALTAAVLTVAALLLPLHAAAGDADVVSGSAFGISITSSVSGIVVAPAPAGVSATAAGLGARLGPLHGSVGSLGLPGLLEIGHIDAMTQGAIAPGGASRFVNSEVALQGVSVAAGLLAGGGVTVTCASSQDGSTGAVRMDAFTLGGSVVPATPAINTVTDIPGVGRAVLNEQNIDDRQGSTTIVVRGAHLQVLPTKDNTALLDIVVGEARCRTGGSGVLPSPARARKVSPSLILPTLGPVPAQIFPTPTSTPALAPTSAAPLIPTEPTPPSAPGPEPSAGPQSMRVSPPAGPPGTVFRTTVTGFAGCGALVVSFDATPLGGGPPDRAGSLVLPRMSIPGNASAGHHDIHVTCTTGDRARRSTGFDVATAGLHRSAFASSVLYPDRIAWGFRPLVASALAAGAILLLAAFPSELFNSTLEANYAEIRGWFGLPPEPVKRSRGSRQGLIFVAFVLLGGVLFGLLSPDFGLNLSSVALALGISVGLVVISLGFRLPLLLHVYTHQRQWPDLKVLPGTALVALACIGISRLVHFQPGYLFGLIAGLDVRQQLGRDTTGKLTLLAALSLVALGMLAWVARTPLAAAAGRPHPGFLVAAAEACLVAIFVLGLETVVFSLLPLRFLDGSKLSAWSRAGWAAAFGLAAFAFIHLLLRPGSGYIDDSQPASRATIVALALFLAFGVFSVGFWAYFRFRPARAAPIVRRP